MMKDFMNTTETIYANGNFTNVNEVHNNTQNMILSGFNQEGGKVVGNIQNLKEESLQNRSTTTGSSRGLSLGINSSGIPNSIGSNWSNTSGNRAYVDNQSTFIVGEGSNLTIGKAENTGGVIGKQDENSTLRINEYVGQDIQNYDSMRTTGGSIGLQTGNIPVSNIGYNQDTRDKEGITRNTVVGNVEIGTSTGVPINRDISKANETTRDSSSSTNINVESQTIEYALNPSKFREDLDKAKQEIQDVSRAVSESINDRGDDNRNFFGQLSEVRLNETINNIAGERLERVTTQEDMKDTLEAAYKDLGYDVNIRISTPSETPELIGKGGTAYLGNDGKHTVIINSEYLNGKSKGEILGVISEEASHIINGVEGRAVVTGTDEKGLESTGRATKEYFEDKYKDDKTTINLTSEGSIDTSNLGTNVGDRRYSTVSALKEDRYKNYKGEALDEKIISDYKLDSTEYYKLKSKLKEGNGRTLWDIALFFLGLTPPISEIVSVIGVVDIAQNILRGVGTEERAAYLVALLYEESRNEMARQIAVRETELMINIAQSGAKTEQEKQMIRNLFIVGANYNFDKLPNGVSIDEYWKKGIAVYNDNRHKISLEELKRMRNRKYKYITNALDTDVYVKPFRLERKGY